SRSRGAEEKRLQREREATLAERKKLEQTAASVARARAELREETGRLVKLVDCSAHGPKNPPPDPSQLEALARTVKAMPPVQAANIVKSLDRPLAVALLRRMKPADAGAVLGKLDAQLATSFVTALAVPEAR